MFSKLLLALGVVFAMSALGNAVKCYECDYYTTKQPKEQQKCDNSVNCPDEHCTTGLTKYENGTEHISRSCGTATFCQGISKLCTLATILNTGVKSCAGECCTGDNCNNYTPSSATGVMVTKFTLSVMVIVGLIFA